MTPDKVRYELAKLSNAVCLAVQFGTYDTSYAEVAEKIEDAINALDDWQRRQDRTDVLHGYNAYVSPEYLDRIAK